MCVVHPLTTLHERVDGISLGRTGGARRRKASWQVVWAREDGSGGFQALRQGFGTTWGHCRTPQARCGGCACGEGDLATGEAARRRWRLGMLAGAQGSIPCCSGSKPLSIGDLAKRDRR